jgi:hypothetical protein
MKGRDVSKSPFVLHALAILGPEEILKLSEVAHHKHHSLKKAAGEDLVVWDEENPTPKVRKSSGAKVIPFPRDLLKEITGAEDSNQSEVVESDNQEIMNETELVLKQRDINRSLDENSHKLDAIKGYQNSSEAYLVKSTVVDGVKEHRFASTSGVLVNKKIA